MSRLPRKAGDTNAERGTRNAEHGGLLAALEVNLLSGPPGYSSDRIAHRSGNSGWFSVVIRYSEPALPPVPRRVPIVR
jgi:hypothetical protein